MDILAVVVEYLFALFWNVWWLLVGIIFGMIRIVEFFYKPIPFTRQHKIWLFVASLIVGQFLAFKTIHEQLEKTKKDSEKALRVFAEAKGALNQQINGLKAQLEKKPVGTKERQSLKQRTLLLANRIQVFARQRFADYQAQGILLYPDQQKDIQKRHDFDENTLRQFSDFFAGDLDSVSTELQSRGLDTGNLSQVRRVLGLPASIVKVSEELRTLASQIDNMGKLTN